MAGRVKFGAAKTPLVAVRPQAAEGRLVNLGQRNRFRPG